MGLTHFLSEHEAQQRSEALIARVAHPKGVDAYSKEEFEKEVKTWFVCTLEIGSALWRNGARNVINGHAKSSATGIPAKEFIVIQACRINVVVGNMWSRSSDKHLRPSDIGGIGDWSGYNEDAVIVIETPARFSEAVAVVVEKMKLNMRGCGCGTDCSTNRCLCKQSQRPCIGCSCISALCRNPFGKSGI